MPTTQRSPLLVSVDGYIDARRRNWPDLVRLRDHLKSNPGANEDTTHLRALGFDQALNTLWGTP